ncbi:MAG: hypothetical protein P8Z81_00115 [Deinococcales bacterium]
MRRFTRIFAPLTASALLALAGTALAFSPTLSSAQVTSAVKQGQSLVSPKHGYPWKHYLLKQFDGGIDLTKSQMNAEIDAIAVGTPYERVRYQSYIDTYQGSPLTTKDANALASRYASTVQFIVFAHSPAVGAKYQDFLTKFGHATLDIQGGGTLEAAKQGTFGPARDFYDVTSGKGSVPEPKFLWLGYVSYRFNLRPLAKQGTNVSNLKGTLTFTDSQGQKTSLTVDLGNYE